MRGCAVVVVLGFALVLRKVVSTSVLPNSSDPCVRYTWRQTDLDEHANVS